LSPGSILTEASTCRLKARRRSTAASSAMRSAAEPSGMVPWSRSVWSCTISSSKLALASA
jgi:hypothetical protein